MNQPASAYFMEERHDPTEAHTLSVLVQNEPGVLARVIGCSPAGATTSKVFTVSRDREPEARLPHHHRHHGHADGDRADQSTSSTAWSRYTASST